jgi:uncharacterized phiE125 gp8 family phage protein
MKNSKVKTAPSVEPITLTEAKAHLRIVISDTTYDTEVTSMIKTARQWIEQRYNIALITQTRVQKQDNFYDRYPIYRNFMGPYYTRYPITLLYPPLQSITSLSYYDTNQALQTLTENTDFYCAGKQTPAAGAQDIEIPRMWPANSWPAFKWIPDAVQIEYVCGFGDDATYVPEPIKMAIKKVVAEMFENRSVNEPEFMASIDEIMSLYQVFDHVGIYA